MPDQTVTRLSLFSGKRENNLDFLRFVFAALVILAHSFVFTNSHLVEPLTYITRGQLDFGGMSVDAFFIISGFLITASYLRCRNMIDYFTKRVLRIYPGFIVCCVLCIVVVGSLGAASRAQYFHNLSVPRLMKDILLLNKIGISDTYLGEKVPGQLNGSLWSIKIEFECYIFIALAGWCGALRRRAVPIGLLAVFATALVCVGNSVVLSHLPFSHVLGQLAMHFRFLMCFLLGAVAYLYSDRIPYNRRTFVMALALFSFAALLPPLGLLLLPISVSYIIFYIAFHPRLRFGRFASKGDMSYGIYLYGWPVQLLLVTFVFGETVNPYLLALTASVAACVCAFASWHLIEKPCLRYKPKQRPAKDDSLSAAEDAHDATICQS